MLHMVFVSHSKYSTHLFVCSAWSALVFVIVFSQGQSLFVIVCVCFIGLARLFNFGIFKKLCARVCCVCKKKLFRPFEQVFF